MVMDITKSGAKNVMEMDISLLFVVNVMVMATLFVLHVLGLAETNASPARAEVMMNVVIAMVAEEKNVLHAMVLE